MKAASAKSLEMLAALQRCRALQPVSRGVTPFQLVLNDEPFCLRRYHRPGQPPGGVPILIVYSTINRPDLLDLTETRSMIRPLLEAGLDVHVVDWGYPLDADSQLDLEDYLDGFLSQCVAWIQQLQAGGGINAVGVCQGGTLLTCYASMYPGKIARLVNLAAPLDFRVNAGVLSRLANTLVTQSAAPGNIDGKIIAAAFAALQPLSLFIKRYELLPAISLQTAVLDDFLRMEAWMYDCPDQPNVMFRRFVRCFYQDNALAKGELQIAGQRIRLDRIEARVLSIHAGNDHLIPPAATRTLATIIPARRYREVSCPGGHLGLFLSDQSRRTVVPAIIAWCNTGAVQAASSTCNAQA